MPKAYAPGSRQLTNGIGVDGHPSVAGVRRPDGRRKAPPDPVRSRQLPPSVTVRTAHTARRQAPVLTASRGRTRARSPATRPMQAQFHADEEDHLCHEHAARHRL